MKNRGTAHGPNRADLVERRDPVHIATAIRELAERSQFFAFLRRPDVARATNTPPSARTPVDAPHTAEHISGGSHGHLHNVG